MSCNNIWELEQWKKSNCRGRKCPIQNLDGLHQLRGKRKKQMIGFANVVWIIWHPFLQYLVVNRKKVLLQLKNYLCKTSYQKCLLKNVFEVNKDLKEISFNQRNLMWRSIWHPKTSAIILTRLQLEEVQDIGTLHSCTLIGKTCTHQMGLNLI